MCIDMLAVPHSLPPYHASEMKSGLEEPAKKSEVD